MENIIIIPLPLCSLNEYIKAERSNRYKAANIKKSETFYCATEIHNAMKDGVQFDWPAILRFTWIVNNRRQDPDNIAFSKKFILDGMQKSGFIENDNLNNILGFIDDFIVDKNEASRVIIAAEGGRDD